MTYSLISAKTAAAFAVKNATAVLPAYAVVTVPVLLSGAFEYLGSSGMAAIAALLGASIRGYKFSLPRPQFLTELGGSSVAGFIFAQADLPFIETYLSHLPPENLALAKGLMIGLFGSLAVGVGSDFIRSYRANKSKIGNISNHSNQLIQPLLP